MKWMMTLLVLFSFAFAGEEHEFHMPRDLGYLNLDAKQKEQISKIVFENRKKSKELHEKREAAQKEMKALFLEDTFDEQKISKIFSELKESSIRLHVNMLKRIHDTLNPKQRELFLKYIKEWEIE